MNEIKGHDVQPFSISSDTLHALTLCVCSFAVFQLSPISKSTLMLISPSKLPIGV